MDVIIGITLQYCFNILFILILTGIPKKKTLFGLLAFLSIGLQALLFSQIGLFIVFYILVSLTLLFYLTAENPRLALVATPMGIVLSILGDHLANVVTLVLNGTLTTGLAQNNLAWHLAVAFLLSLIFALLSRKFLVPKLKEGHWVLISLLLYFLLITYYIVILATSYSGYNKTVFLLENVFFTLFFVCTCLAALLYKKTMETKFTQELYQKEVELQLNYIKKIEKNYDELRKFKHDYRSLLFTLEAYIKENDLPGLRNYFEEHILPTSRFL